MITQVLEEHLMGLSIVEMSDRKETLFCDMIARQGTEPQTY